MRQRERLIEPVKQESKKSEAEIKEIVCSVTQRTILKVGVPSNGYWVYMYVIIELHNNICLLTVSDSMAPDRHCFLVL